MRRRLALLALAVGCQLFAADLARAQDQKTEDTPHASGQIGSFVVCVRNDSAGTTFTGANGDYSPFACDSAGRIWTVPQPGTDIGDTTINNGAGAAAVNIQDGGNSITVDGPLTDAQLRASAVPVDSELPASAALADATANPSIPAIAGYCLLYNGTTWDRCRGDTTNGLDVDVTRSALPTGASTLTEQQTQTTALQLIDNLPRNEDTASADADTGVMILARRTATPANTSGADLDYEALQMSAGRLWTSSTIDAAIPAGNNNIGDVDVATLPNVAQATAANLNAEVQGDAAHGAAVSGNPLLEGGEARTSNGTAVSNGQAVRAQYDVVGRQVTSPYTLYDNVVRGCGNATTTSDTAVIAAAGVGIRNYVTTITIVNTSATATYVSVKDGTTVLLEIPAPANNGGAIVPLPVPIRTTANTAFNFASASAVTTMRVCAAGFTAP